jgi:5-methylcytosine-specific restriction endonuclease McrA
VIGRWSEVVAGERCARCEAKRWPLFVVVFAVSPRGLWGERAPGGYRYRRRATCVDRVACDERIRRRQEGRAQRGAALVVARPPSPGGPPGTCQWCGTLLDGATLGKPAPYGRLYCRKDREGRACNVERANSVVWSARAALELTVPPELFVCADCETRCGHEETRDEHGRVTRRVLHADWEADHDVPLWAGGAHDLSNLRVRCTDCHRDKTAREAADRAARGGRVACDE